MNNRSRNKRPFKNCKWLKMWKMTNEEEETYSPIPLDFTKRLTTYSDNVTTNSTPLYGDGEDIEDAISEGPGSLQVGIHHLEDLERVDVYNETANTDNAVISTGEEIPPYFCVALAAEKRNGMLNLRKFFKVTFAKHEESVNQQESGGISYSMTTLNGTYSKNTRLGIKSVRVEVDPSSPSGQSFIRNWYNNPEFVGYKVEVTSDVKVNGVSVSGRNIEENNTITISALATGGDAPYTYTYEVANYLDPNNPGTYEPVAGNTYTPDEEAILWFRITATDSSGESAVAYHNVIVNS